MALATTLALGAATPQLAVMKGPSLEKVNSQFDKKVLNQLDAQRIYDNIDTLAQEPRVAGTDAEDQAVEFIAEEFESYGYDVEIQPFTFFGYTPPSSLSLSVEGFEGELNPRSFTYSVNGDVTGELVDVGLGTVEDVAGLDLSGKIALIQRGNISFGQKVLNAAERGAAGVVIYNNVDGVLNGTLGAYDERYVAAVSLSKSEGEALKALAGSTATLTVEGAEAGDRTSHNVIATKEPTNQKKANDDIIVVGAHHDSVPGAPGANDDASGTAMTLELARVLKNVPTDTELRFVTFGAEELGLIGSYHYVDTLSDEEIDNTVANFNLDMVGSRDAGDLVMRTLDGQPNLVTELSQKSSLKLNGEATPFSQGGSSDHVPFAAAGIPAALFIHSPLEPWYHTPDDTIDKIDIDKLQDVAEIVGSAVYDLAQFDHPSQSKNKEKVDVEADMIFEQSVR
nr:DUF4910 domain-containing protein [Jeotgalibacillus malaysiensis]